MRTLMPHQVPPPPPPWVDLSKPCTKCRHRMRTLGYWLGIPNALLCNHPQFAVFRADPVTGTQRSEMPPSCARVRDSSARCGLDGKMWEPLTP